MDGSSREPGDMVIHDSRPFEVAWEAFYGLVFFSWSIRRPLIGVPFLVCWIAVVVVTYRRPQRGPVANAAGISGLRLRVPRAERRAWYRRREVLSSVTPWSAIASIGIKPSPTSLSGIRVHMKDGREADLDVRTITRRGLRQLVADIERLRPAAA